MTDIDRLNHVLALQLKFDQLPHAFIFTGSSAKKQALAIAAALECQSRREDGSACTKCSSCRNMQAGTHPDVTVLTPQGASHKVESMRALVAAANRSKMFGNHKVFILEDAEKMSVEAANTLLKLLEEPAPDTLLILLSQLPERFLPTILSRCQFFTFSDHFQEDDVQCPAEIMGAVTEFLNKLPQLPLFEVLKSAKIYDGDRESMKLFYFGLLQQFHAAACGKIKLPMSLAAILDSAEFLEKAIDLIAHGANQKLLTDVVFLRLRQNCV